jgi:hypothetical protein
VAAELAKDAKAAKRARPFWLMSKLKKAGHRAREGEESKEEEIPVTAAQESMWDEIDASRPRFSPVQPRGRQRHKDLSFKHSPEKRRMDDVARKRLGDILISHVKDYGNDLCSMTEVVRVIEMGAPIDYKDTYGNTPLMWAVIKKTTEMVVLLMKRGAGVNVHNNNGTVPIMEAARDPYRTAIAGKLVEHKKLDLNMKTTSGYTCLMIAVQANNLDFIDLLVKKEVVHHLDLDAQDKDGFTACHHAAQLRNLECIQQLLHFGASMEVGDTRNRLVIDLIPRPDDENGDVEDVASEACRTWMYNHYHTVVQKRGLGQSPWTNNADYEWCGSLHDTAYKTPGILEENVESAMNQQTTTRNILMRDGGKVSGLVV